MILRKEVRHFVSLNGGRIDIVGVMDIYEKDVGVVTVRVSKDMAHEMVVGWDQLHRYGWTLMDTPHQRQIVWAQEVYNVVGLKGCKSRHSEVQHIHCIR